MKKIQLIIVILLGFIACTSCSGDGKYRKESEAALLKTLKTPSTYKMVSFELLEKETLSQQIQERISYFEETLENDRKEVLSTKETIKDFEKKDYMREFIPMEKANLADAEKKVADDLKMVNFLKKQYDLDSGKLNTVVSRTYRLTYDAANSFNAMLRSYMDFRFNEDGVLTAIKPEDDSWSIVGNFFSIPGYYEALNK